MDFSSSQWLQLNIAAALAVIAFIFVYSAPTKWVVTGLILIIPFQIISSRYGSLNIYLVYLIAFVFLLRGQIRELPFIGFVAAIVFAYAVSFSQVPPVTRADHLLYLFFVGSNFLVFYIIYNYYRSNPDARGFLYLLVFLNVLVLIYSFAQLIVGINPNSPLFSGEIGLRPPREDGRLTGPFGTVGLTAEYTVIAVFVLGFMLMTMRLSLKSKLFLFFLILGNFAVMIATGNRGGILVLVMCGVFFLFLFRRELGGKGIANALGGIAFAFSVAAAIIINYSDFNMLFDRLAETEIEEGIPDTRSRVWPDTWARIQEHPIAGQGPQLRLSDSTYQRPGAPQQVEMPHNLYLYLMDTLGTLGLLAYLGFFFILYYRYASCRFDDADPVVKGIPKLAMVLMLVFIIDQMKIEFLRSIATEYQHFMFMLWGALASLTCVDKTRSV